VKKMKIIVLLEAADDTQKWDVKQAIEDAIKPYASTNRYGAHEQEEKSC